MPENASVARLPDRLLLPLAFDPDRLLQDLDSLRDVAWTDHFVKQNYDGDWSALPLRAPAGATHPIRMIYSDPSAHVFEDTPWLERAPYLREVLGCFQCPLKVARLMRLAPGSTIKEHCDADLDFANGVVRLHVPIVTNAKVEFVLNGERIVMAPGRLWYLRLADPHKVSNLGASDRVHLVIDAEVNGWLDALFRQAAARADF